MQSEWGQCKPGNLDISGANAGKNRDDNSCRGKGELAGLVALKLETRATSMMVGFREPLEIRCPIL